MIQTKFGKYPDKFEQYLASSKLVDIDNPLVRQKAHKLVKNLTSDREAVKNIYNFVRDKIPYTFTHNLQKASEVLKEKKGQCNTKTTLTIALLRAVGIPSRYHCGSVKKTLFKNIIPIWAYPLTPKEIPGHCWPEVFINDKWTAIENVVDLPLYQGIQRKMQKQGSKESVGCGLSKSNFQEEWDCKSDILMQGGALAKDAGTYGNADDYLEKTQHFLHPIKEKIREKIIKPVMNKKLSNLRNA